MFFMVFLQTVFVFCIFIRIANFVFKKCFFKTQKMTKIGISVACFYFLNFIFFLKTQFKAIYFFNLLIPILLLFSIYFYKVKTRESRLTKDFYNYLITVSIAMKVGQSFRSALQNSLMNLKEEHRVIVSAIIDSVVFSQQPNLDLKSSFEQEIHREISKIDENSHRSLYRLSLWMRQIEKRFEFRHKSGQILSQLYIQVVLLSLMYFALFIFTVRNYGLREHVEIIFYSLVLFAIGLVVSFFLGRKIKWKF